MEYLELLKSGYVSGLEQQNGTFRQKMGKAEQKRLTRYSPLRLIRRYQFGSRRMTIRSKLNFRVSLKTKVMDDFCAVIHIVARSTTDSQLGQRVCERIVLIGCSKLWKSWARKRRAAPCFIEYQSGYISEKVIYEKIGAHSNLGIGRTR